MPAAWEDPRIVSGMKQQLRWRKELLEAGKKPLGWKLAFGGPAAMERLGINAPLVGFLMADAVAASGSTISADTWTKPAAEPEITVYLEKDLAADVTREMTIAAIRGLGAAIEIADVDHPPEDVEGTLARNIYQRHVVLSGCDATHAGGVFEGLQARVYRNGEKIANTSDLQALTGELIENVRHVAKLLGIFGETLHAGQIIIAGSITPPIWVEPGGSIRFHLEPLKPISVTLTAQHIRKQ